MTRASMPLEVLHMNARTTPLVLILSITLPGVAPPLGQTGGAGNTQRASAILQPAELNGPHFKVDDTVRAEGFFNVFTITSDYGPFTAIGRSELARRIDEIRAIGALDDVSKSKVFIESAGGAVVDVGKSAAKMVTDPKETAQGIGAGVKRLGVNLGRASKRAVTKDGGADSGESNTTTAADTVLGVSSAMRRWAAKVGADPYTTNLALREALKSIAQVDAAGSIATKVVVPIPMVVGSAATISDLVWSKDPEELRKLNERRLETLGVPDGVAGAFLRSGWYTLTLQTRLVAALDAVKRPGCSNYVNSATVAASEREALFYVESAEMLQRVHAQSPVERILPDSRPVVAAAAGTASLLAPIDILPPTSEVFAALREITRRARTELKASTAELVITGRVAAESAQELRRLGWKVRESVPAR